MKLQFEQVPAPESRQFAAVLLDYLRRIATQVNLLSEGRISGQHTAMNAAPTSGVYAVHDFVPNAARGTELGSPGSKYTVHGWVCSSESPLTFLEVRCPTGN